MVRDNLSTENITARFICHDHGYTCDVWPVGDNGQFRVAIYKDEKLVLIRKLVYEYEQKVYALYESYRALASKIIKNG